MENQNKTEKPEEECESCPVCLEEYGKQNDGTFLPKDGLCNSTWADVEEFECKHFVCVKCCSEMYCKWYDENNGEACRFGTIPCPLCRTNWYGFLKHRHRYDDYDNADYNNPTPSEIETKIFDQYEKDDE